MKMVDVVCLAVLTAILLAAGFELGKDIDLTQELTWKQKKEE